MLTLGVAVGALAGYYGGWTNQALMQVVDVSLAFPGLILAIAIAGMVGPGLLNVTAAMRIPAFWVGYARIIRGLVLPAREREYVQAAPR